MLKASQFGYRNREIILFKKLKRQALFILCDSAADLHLQFILFLYLTGFHIRGLYLLCIVKFL